MVDARPLPDKMKLSTKCGADRPLIYLVELHNKPLERNFVLRDLHFPVSVMSFQEKAKLVIQPYNPRLGQKIFQLYATCPYFDQPKTAKATGRCS